MPRKRRATADSDSDDEFDESRHPQRNAANARERARMRVLSKAFCRLKTTLPWVPADTKLSKLDTLRLATSYIAHLRAVLMDQPVSTEQLHKHPLTLTWPFSFQRPDSSTDTGGERDQQPWADAPVPPLSRPQGQGRILLLLIWALSRPSAPRKRAITASPGRLIYERRFVCDFYRSRHT
ncbi:hypothetical protein NQ318_022169 [Aromia moschata]|uniref:BHLH domain-containing protein n=1 Tax=Aromia moschata TaxID=1265417 RepID=A0AAV8Z7K0_9CUCU|nr:hypothetical protein NQ318_022169 [Aromia moschata]